MIGSLKIILKDESVLNIIFTGTGVFRFGGGAIKDIISEKGMTLVINCTNNKYAESLYYGIESLLDLVPIIKVIDSLKFILEDDSILNIIFTSFGAFRFGGGLIEDVINNEGVTALVNSVNDESAKALYYSIESLVDLVTLGSSFFDGMDLI